MDFIRRLARYLISDFKKRVCNKQGFVVSGTAAALIGSAALSGGAGWLGSMMGKGEKKQTQASIKPEWYQTPDYPEATGARASWWSKLQEWGGMPEYGAIAPNWEDIWGQAKKRVSQYYWGGPGGEPGLAGKVRASAARRGVSESPAMETQLARMGYSEADKLREIATEQATKEAEFGEKGRMNWLTSLMGLAQQKPSGVWSTGAYAPAQQYEMGMGDVVGDVGSGLFDLAANYYQTKWLEDMRKGTQEDWWKNYQKYATTQSSLMG